MTIIDPPFTPVIRRATIADVEGIAKVHVQSWRETYRGLVPDVYLAELSIEQRASLWEKIITTAKGAGSLPWVAVAADGAIVGFASGGPSRSSDYAGYGELYAIYLLNSCKGEGTGKSLFARIRSDLAAAGFTTLMAWVLKENPALAFYRHLGGRIASEKIENIGGAELVECAVTWVLP